MQQRLGIGEPDWHGQPTARGDTEAAGDRRLKFYLRPGDYRRDNGGGCVPRAIINTNIARAAWKIREVEIKGGNRKPGGLIPNSWYHKVVAYNGLFSQGHRLRQQAVVGTQYRLHERGLHRRASVFRLSTGFSPTTTCHTTNRIGSATRPKSAPGTVAVEGGWNVTTTNTYNCINYASSARHPDELRANADSVFNLDREATQFVTDKIQMRWERLGD